ncbi:MAG: 30S ribosomal protein S16 [Thermoplasmata archaeon]|nr:MAG: 30S ribosomal protein S16 [Thermoplasmata archaeon]
MLKIRLQRTGKKNSPSFRVVLAEHTAPPQGKFIEILGYYNPRKKKKSFKKERIEYWVSKGAQFSPTVYNLLIEEGIIKGIKVKAWKSKKKGKPAAEEKLEKPEASKEEKPAEDLAKEQGEETANKEKEEEKKVVEEKKEEVEKTKEAEKEESEGDQNKEEKNEKEEKEEVSKDKEEEK